MDISKIAQMAASFPEWQLLSFQYFFVDEGLISFAFQVADDTRGDPFPFSSCLPGDRIGIVAGNSLWLLFWLKDERFRRRVALSTMNQSGAYKTVGWWYPGSREFGAIDKLERCVEKFAYIVALLNEPRVVLKSAAGNRQQRRQVHRGFGIAVDAWSRVSWDISKPTVAKVTRDPSFHKVPMHWRRGHFRRAEPHFKGAMQRPDAIREEDRCLWWQWIEGQWVGHPAFGVKKSVHAPKLSGRDIARRSAA